MRKCFIFLSLLVTGTLLAQVPVRRLTEREKIILKINRKADADTLIELLRKFDSDIRRGVKDKKILSSLRYYSFASTIDKRWIKYRWFIADSGLSKKWLKGIRDLLTYMSKTRSYLEAARFNGRTQTAKYKKAREYFATAYKRFAKLIAKPLKVSSKARRNAQHKKTMWQKNMRKKYNIKKEAI